jgi:hypothetical protein
MWRRADIRVRIRPKLSAGIFFSQQSRWQGRSMFRLHKWYLDVVTDTGDVLILYAGTVEWGRIVFDMARGAGRRSAKSASRSSCGQACCWTPRLLRCDCCAGAMPS